jgi:hypothetical protein
MGTSFSQKPIPRSPTPTSARLSSTCWKSVSHGAVVQPVRPARGEPHRWPKGPSRVDVEAARLWHGGTQLGDGVAQQLLFGVQGASGEIVDGQCRVHAEVDDCQIRSRRLCLLPVRLHVLAYSSPNVRLVREVDR